MRRSKQMKTRISVSLVVVAYSLLVLNPCVVRGAWDDKSDELPGMGGVPTLALVGLGVAATGLLIWAIQSGGDDASEKQGAKDTGTETDRETEADSSPDDDQSWLDEVPFDALRRSSRPVDHHGVRVWALPASGGVNAGFTFAF
jgi:hypothetical protein